MACEIDANEQVEILATGCVGKQAMGAGVNCGKATVYAAQSMAGLYLRNQSMPRTKSCDN